MESINITSFDQVPHGLTVLLQRVDELINLQKANHSTPAPKPEAAEEYLTRSQVKDLLKISYPTLKVWTNEGKLKGYRLGTRVRYKSSEIDEALQAMKSTSIAA